jgi:hypothetical protein
LTTLGEQFGFTLRIVKELYMQFGTLEKTVQALRTLNSMMRGAQNELYEKMQRLGRNKDDDTEDEDLIPEGVIPKNVSSREKGKMKETGEGESHDTPPSKRHRLALKYRPFTDVEDQSEYSPPSRTRAGRYTKLQKEGREEEAVLAASGGTVHGRNESMRGVHHRVTTIKRGMEPSSPLDVDRRRSPTPTEEEAHVRETGDEEGHEDEDSDADADVEPMDISTEIRAPTPEVVQVDDEAHVLRAEHKSLCSEVTLKHPDILSAFEKRHGGHPWRRESRDLFEERFSTLKEAQEIRRQQHDRIEAKKAEEGEEHGLY